MRYLCVYCQQVVPADPKDPEYLTRHKRKIDGKLHLCDGSGMSVSFCEAVE